MAAITAQPSVFLYINGSFIAFDESGEVVETVELNPDGSPDWAMAGGCDHRGIGGAAGYAALVAALEHAEANARAFGDPIERVAVV